MSVLLTGGAGYIGSHTALELLRAGYDVVIADSLINSSYEAVKRLEILTGKDIKFYQIDIRDGEKLDKVFEENDIDSVVHFAGLKAVGESSVKPLLYYETNIDATISLCYAMEKHNVKRIVFSSSATVYGVPDFSPIPEDARRYCSNPYGWTKYMIEQILRDEATARGDWSVILLRYFNPIGADASGMIGEDQSGIPNNLMPYITKVAVGTLPYLRVFGNDYNTVDGTGVRDYIHVSDLARGHIAALEYGKDFVGSEAFNLGTGKGTSVLQLVNAFMKVNNIDIPYKIVERRPGDIDEYYGDPSKANKVLNWYAKHDIEDMCRDSWNFQKNNPNGYKE